MTVRYLISFSKDSEIKFISHLDLMRSIQRIIRRADIPVEYSNGFNPHMAVSIAQPLSVGIYSDREYMDVVLKEEVNESEIIKRLNEKSPMGIKFFKAQKIVNGEKKVPQSMALIDAARYIIRIKIEDADKAVMNFKNLLLKSEWITVKETKKTQKTIDMKKLIIKLDYILQDGYLAIDTTVRCGSRENLSPSLLSAYIIQNTDGVNKEAFCDIKRCDMFFKSKDGLKPLIELNKEA